MSEAPLELFTDIDMLLMVKNGIGGGISQISQRYAKAKIPNTPDYSGNEAPSYTMYWEANNLYGGDYVSIFSLWRLWMA